MAEVSEFVIRHLVSPLAQLVDDQADITHGEELIPYPMGNVHGQAAGLGTALVRPQYAGHNRKPVKALRPGKADFIAERTAIGQSGEENALRVDAIARLDLIQDVE